MLPGTARAGREAAPRYGQARDENWSHEEYLAALLQRQVADRESAGTIMRIRTAHFPQIKTLEDFNLDHLPPHCDEICWPTWELAPSF